MPNRNNNNSILNLIHEGFINIVHTTIEILCTFKFLNVHIFHAYIQALEHISKFNNNASMHKRSCTKALLTFFAIQHTHSSSFVDYLKAHGGYYTFPSFVHSYLLNISIRSKSMNKMSGETVGTITPQQQIATQISWLCQNDGKNLIRFLTGTSFDTLIKREDGSIDQNRVKSIIIDIKDYLGTILKGYNIADSLEEHKQHYVAMRILNEFHTMMYFSDRIPLLTHYYLFNESKNYSIYRYRNCTSVTNGYLVQQTTLSSLGSPSFKQHCAFLRLFVPQFDSSNILIGGDAVIDLSSIRYKDAWLIYFNTTLLHSDNVIRGTRRNNQREETPNTTDPLAFSDHDVSTIENTRAIFNSECRYSTIRFSNNYNILLKNDYPIEGLMIFNDHIIQCLEELG